jgi:hypothetical protein
MNLVQKDTDINRKFFDELSVPLYFFRISILHLISSFPLPLPDLYLIPSFLCQNIK